MATIRNLLTNENIQIKKEQLINTRPFEIINQEIFNIFNKKRISIPLFNDSKVNFNKSDCEFKNLLVIKDGLQIDYNSFNKDTIKEYLLKQNYNDGIYFTTSNNIYCLFKQYQKKSEGYIFNRNIKDIEIIGLWKVIFDDTFMIINGNKNTLEPELVNCENIHNIKVVYSIDNLSLLKYFTEVVEMTIDNKKFKEIPPNTIPDNVELLNIIGDSGILNINNLPSKLKEIKFQIDNNISLKHYLFPNTLKSMTINCTIHYANKKKYLRNLPANLEKLFLINCYTDEKTNFPNTIKELILNETKIDYNKIPLLESLEKLHLSYFDLTDENENIFKNLENLSELSFGNLSDNRTNKNNVDIFPKNLNILRVKNIYDFRIKNIPNNILTNFDYVFLGNYYSKTNLSIENFENDFIEKHVKK